MTLSMTIARSKSSKSNTLPSARERLGFKGGVSGPHAARTIMFDDLVTLFDRVPAEAERQDYRVAIVDENDLGKPSRSARALAFEHLASLYGLDPAIPLFRVLRRLWDRDGAARPLLALAMAFARDPLLRATHPWILAQPEGTVVTRAALEEFLAATFPDRFSPVMLAGLANRINGTWTQSGHLRGKMRKVRARAAATPTNVAFNLFLGYLEGHSGQGLLKAPWMTLLDLTPEGEAALLRAAADQELLVHRAAAGVMEIRFPGWLNDEEATLREESLDVQA